MQDLHLLPGSPVPDPARRVLDAKTVRAIEEGKPDQIQEPGVRVLPAPLEGPALPALIEYKPVGEPTSGEIILRPTAQPPARAAAAGGLAPPAALPPSHPLASLSGRPASLPALRKAAPLAPSKPKPAASPKPDAAVDAEVSDLYRICEACKTEILADDNFCYYCGMKYRRTYADERRAAAERRRRFIKALWTLALLIVIAAIAVGGYLYLGGFVSRQNIKDIEQIGRDALKGNLPKNLEELTISPRAIADAAHCRRNLTRMDQAKRAAAAKKGLKQGTIPLADVLAELKMDKLLACPTSGTYTLNPIGQLPTCSVGNNGTTSTLDDHITTDK
jgi:hypothetical protein